MATTTPNFGWPVPTSTDLVKDGATAMEALGDAIDTSMVDLKGGTTGQVLAKASNTDMDFSWVAQDDSNAIQNTIVDAKGDLIAASAADTPARLAVGSNGETLVADSSTATGLRWQGGQKVVNAIINGGMDIWQRGTSAAGSYPTYLADRWMNYRSTTGSTFSRQNTNDTTNLPTIQYCQRISRDSGNTSTVPIYISQSLENSISKPFVGQTVTLSWYARAGANFSAASSNMAIDFIYGTGTDQNAIAGFTGATSINTGSGVRALTTTWQRFTITGTVSTSATQIGVNFYYTPVGTAGAADYMEITGVQLELGSVASTFSRAGGTIQGELAACQRYYVRFTAGGDNYVPLTSIGLATGTTTINNTFQFPTTMRVAPSSVDFASLSVYGGASGGSPGFLSVSNLVQNRASNSISEIGSTVSGASLGGVYRIQPNNAAGYVGFSAEL